MGFVQGVASPCMFYHPGWNVVCAVHGDDYTLRGPKRSLDLFLRKLEQLYEFKIGGRLGPAVGDDKEGTILNRVVRWTEKGLEYEADPRQLEKVLYELGLEGANSLATPGLRPTAAQITDDAMLEADKHTLFRGVAARCNYLSSDRPTCSTAPKKYAALWRTPAR